MQHLHLNLWFLIIVAGFSWSKVKRRWSWRRFFWGGGIRCVHSMHTSKHLKETLSYIKHWTKHYFADWETVSFRCSAIRCHGGRGEPPWTPRDSLCRKAPGLVLGPCTCKSGPNSQTSCPHQVHGCMSLSSTPIGLLADGCAWCQRVEYCLFCSWLVCCSGTVPPSCRILFQPLGKQVESLCIFLCCPAHSVSS